MGLSSNALFAQKKWFTVYADSASLINDARMITTTFIMDIKNINPDLDYDIQTHINTTPYLIYYHNKTANLSLWDQLPLEFKDFFFKITDNAEEAKKTFGLFFNGFYLPHELGHGLQHLVEGTLEKSYTGEHFANKVSMLWWKKQGWENELKQCYELAKKILSKLPVPVIGDKTSEEYLKENYGKVVQDPFIYGFFQMNSIIDVYEDTTLPDFDTFIRDYLDKKRI